MASSSQSSSASEAKHPLLKEVRSHEVSIAELNSLSSSRVVYQKNGSIFFRTSVKSAITSEQNTAKARLQKINSERAKIMTSSISKINSDIVFLRTPYVSSSDCKEIICRDM
ncbi:hypothetical protein AMTRI_Chr03g144660 [Amborella trichopoda]